jgi:hypothetical protein
MAECAVLAAGSSGTICVSGTNGRGTLFARTRSMADHSESDRIGFISSYCDSWCERCAFTMRCSHFAVKMALEMCDGDHAAALELAVGRPARADGREDEVPEWLRDLENLEPNEAEAREFERLEAARDERLDASPLTTDAEIIRTLTCDWLESHRSAAAPQLADAIRIISWDCDLISVKIHRALHGRDEAREGEAEDDDPVQNDWNGSAKVALISIRRSAGALRAVAAATADPEAAALADRLDVFQADVEREFPDAWRFVRPGFDESPGVT